MKPTLSIDRTAAKRRVALDGGSWVDVVDRFVCDPAAELDSLIATTSWQATEVLKYDKYVPDRRLSAGLRSELRPLLRQAELHLHATYGVALAGVAAIQYRDGNDFQGLHSDREMRWLDETLVAIIVLGQRRPFVLRPRVRWADAVDRLPAGADERDIVLHPGEGDLFVMGGRCQRDWLHSVPRHDTTLPRVSLTWRWTSKRGRPDTNPTFYDGFHFSDGPRRPGTRRRPA